MAFLGKKYGQTLRRGDKKMSWPAAKSRSLARARVAGAQVHRQFFLQPHPRNRRQQILLNVVSERPERGDVETMYA